MKPREKRKLRGRGKRKNGTKNERKENIGGKRNKKGTKR